MKAAGGEWPTSTKMHGWQSNKKVIFADHFGEKNLESGVDDSASLDGEQQQ